MQKDLISILTPFKNSSTFLSECIQSIRDQTYLKWELLVVDDHSTDDSYAVVASFAQSDRRIKLFKNTGHGIIDALQLAFEHSSGKFITRMDSDDLMAPIKLQTMQCQLESYGRGHLALGLVNYFSETGIGDGYANYEKWLNELSEKGTNFGEIYKECVIPSPCWMLHREDLLACDAFESDIYPEDYDLAFRFYKNGLKCIPSEQILHYWRDYSTRTSRIDPNYTDNHFLILKVNYFLELDRNTKQPLILWGAGFKGKFCAKLLKKNNIPFIWICNNPKKIGKQIYNMELHSISALEAIKKPQVLITVANKTSQKRIKIRLENAQLSPAMDYFFFC